MATSTRSSAPSIDAEAMGLKHLADPVLDPIHFGFTASLQRYAELRRRAPDVEILMGTGNLTELTDADSQGVTAVLLGICSELHIRNVLVVQVCPHTRRTVEEHDAARRLMFARARGQELAEGLRRRAPVAARSGALSRRRPSRSRQSPGRCATRISASRWRPTGSTSTTATATTFRERSLRLFEKLGVAERRRACLLSRRRAGQGRDRLRPRQALCAGRAARLGRRRRPQDRGSDAARARGRDTQVRAQERSSEDAA